MNEKHLGELDIHLNVYYDSTCANVSELDRVTSSCDLDTFDTVPNGPDKIFSWSLS